ncbi:hypothetical protein B0O80DRAFT_422609 [Mortierella sp. GBAus27b]|nr:hypothetical protein B0O80DRAFT_422609 [Mortierella sp. GBAus27b]
MTGEVTKHSPERSGYPVISQLDKRQETEPRENFWSERFLVSGMAKNEIGVEATAIESRLELEEAEIQKLKKILSNKLTNLTMAARNFEQNLPGSQESLHEARQAVRADRRVLIPREEGLRTLREEILLQQDDSVCLRRIVLSNQRVEGSQLHNSHMGTSSSRALMATQTGRRQVVFAGTDPEIWTMTETVPQTTNQPMEHISRYQDLHNSRPTREVQAPSRMETVARIKLPKARTITAEQINEVTHAKKTSWNRENQLRLERNVHVRETLQTYPSKRRECRSSRL